MFVLNCRGCIEDLRTLHSGTLWVSMVYLAAMKTLHICTLARVLIESIWIPQPHQDGKKIDDAFWRVIPYFLYFTIFLFHFQMG